MAGDIDIVERLRSLADCDARSGEPLGKCMREAADTITALRSRIEELERERDEARENKPGDHVWVMCPNGHGGIVHQHFDWCGCCPECGTVLVDAAPPALRDLGKRT